MHRPARHRAGRARRDHARAAERAGAAAAGSAGRLDGDAHGRRGDPPVHPLRARGGALDSGHRVGLPVRAPARARSGACGARHRGVGRRHHRQAVRRAGRGGRSRAGACAAAGRGGAARGAGPRRAAASAAPVRRVRALSTGVLDPQRLHSRRRRRRRAGHRDRDQRALLPVRQAGHRAPGRARPGDRARGAERAVAAEAHPLDAGVGRRSARWRRAPTSTFPGRSCGARARRRSRSSSTSAT